MTPSIETVAQNTTSDASVRCNVKSRGLKSATALSESRPHGTRIKYMGGCRCSPCRAANTQYEKDRVNARRAGDWNGIVNAADARQHIEQLAKQNVGRRAIGAATDIADTILTEIKSGKRQYIRAGRLARFLRSPSIAVQTAP